MSDNFTRHESKSNVTPTPKTVIVEAYGLRKCPRLVEQVRSLTHSLTESLWHTLYTPFTCYLTHSLTLTHSLHYCGTPYILPTPTHSLTHYGTPYTHPSPITSLTHCIPVTHPTYCLHLLTYSLTHCHSLLLTHSLTNRSLTMISM